MFTYNIAKEADNQEFEKACQRIESGITDLKKEDVLVDVDGSVIQIYRKNKSKIKVYNDYEVDAVYIDSDIDLAKIIN